VKSCISIPTLPLSLNVCHQSANQPIKQHETDETSPAGAVAAALPSHYGSVGIFPWLSKRRPATAAVHLFLFFLLAPKKAARLPFPASEDTSFSFIFVCCCCCCCLGGHLVCEERPEPGLSPSVLCYRKWPILLHRS